MIKTLKLSLSLLGNQFLASVAGFMCVIFVWLLAGNSILAHIIFLLFTYPFFVYIEYRAAYNSGFHDPDRRNAPDKKSYLCKGAVAGLISAIPLYVLIILFFIARGQGIGLLTEYAKLYARIGAMYYNWPMCNIFPNHIASVFLSSMIPPVIIPMIGYIFGYKHIMLTDKFVKLFKIKPGKHF